MSLVADNLKYIRMIRGYSVKEVADKLGKAPNTIVNWEKGKISPPFNDVLELSKIYNITLNQIAAIEPCEEIIDFIQKQQLILADLKSLEKEKAIIEKRIKYCKEKLSRESD